MKRILSIFAAMTCLLCACASSNGAEEEHVLIVYFSRTGEQAGVGTIETGNTAIVAQDIAALTGGDIFELVPEEDNYPLTYDALYEYACQEKEAQARPAYKGNVPDLSAYTTVCIGAPVWHADWPMILYTFFEANKEGLAGKRLVPFCTHAGSRLSGLDSKLAKACPDCRVTEGLAILGEDAQNNPEAVQEAVAKWLKKLGLLQNRSQ
ncbi:MAG: flavodoxin [Solobacterium sp.]|nr:flavodoxin [Solobacterium sp.]